MNRRPAALLTAEEIGHQRSVSVNERMLRRIGLRDERSRRLRTRPAEIILRFPRSEIEPLWNVEAPVRAQKRIVRSSIPLPRRCLEP